MLQLNGINISMKILLHYLPTNKMLWDDSLSKSRKLYQDWVKELVIDPHSSGVVNLLLLCPIYKSNIFLSSFSFQPHVACRSCMHFLLFIPFIIINDSFTSNTAAEPGKRQQVECLL